MTTKHQQIIDKIDLILDGEIKRLEFGCRVLLEGKCSMFVCCITPRIQYLCQKVGVYEKVEFESDKDTIIGKPITLHYLFKVINKLNINHLNYLEKKLGVYNGADGIDISPTFQEVIYREWNYNVNDDLIEQCKSSPEFEKFICEIFNIN